MVVFYVVKRFKLLYVLVVFGPCLRCGRLACGGAVLPLSLSVCVVYMLRLATVALPGLFYLYNMLSNFK